MTWFKVDDSFWGHPKQTSLPKGAVALWVRAGSWSANLLTDGAIPAHMIAMFGCTKADARALVEAGLWESVEDSYQFHDWFVYQPTREAVEKKRNEEAERKADWRRKRAAQRTVKAQSPEDVPVGQGQDNPVLSRGTDAVVPDVSRSSRPDPTRPDPSLPTEETQELLSADADDDRFDEFWRHYPRKEDKVKARKAWAKLTKNVAPQDIIDGLTAYAFSPDRKYQPLPTSWLNGQRWEDEQQQTRLFDANQLPEPGMGWSDTQLDMVLGKDGWQPAPCPDGQLPQAWDYRERAIHRAQRIAAAEKATGRAA